MKFKKKKECHFGGSVLRPGEMGLEVKIEYGVAMGILLTAARSLLRMLQQSVTGSSKRNLFSHSPRGYKSKIKMLVGLVSSEACLLGL